jgi:hypothetical protein
LQIIGLTGKAGHGKDTAADLIQEAWSQNRGTSSARLAFADALREEVALAFGVDPRMFSDRALKETRLNDLAPKHCLDLGFLAHLQGDGIKLFNDEPLTPRFVMQRWGTEYRRATDPDYWIHRAMAQIADWRWRGMSLVVVTDVRFINEAFVLKQAGAQIWRISRPGHPSSTSYNQHASELQQDSIGSDAIFTNDTLENLKSALRDAVSGVGR